MKINLSFASFAFALLAANGLCAGTARAVTQLSRAVDLTNYVTKTKADDVKEASKAVGSAVWKSTYEGQKESFDGYFIATSPETKLAVRSDDGVNVSRDGTPLLNNSGTKQHWPDPESFADLGGNWTKGSPFRLQMSYQNVLFSGADADGISLMAYNGTGKVVTVDVSVDSVGEETEETDGALIGLNDNWDEKNKDAAGLKAGDNKADATAGQRIVSTDTDLKDATLTLNGQGEQGVWWLAVPQNIKVWQKIDEKWEEVVTNQEYAATLPATIALKVEGVSIASDNLVASLRLTTPFAGVAIHDIAKVSVFKVNLTAHGLEMGSDGFLKTGVGGVASDATIREVDEDAPKVKGEINPGAFIHFNLDDDNESHSMTTETGRKSKTPGADYTETTNPVENEDDLKKVSLELLGLEPTLGKLVLVRSPNISVWKNPTKGDTNAVLLGGTSQVEWDLSVSSQRADFQAVQNSLWVQGVTDNGVATLVLQYQRQVGDRWQTLASDTVNYTVIAANDGLQPFDRALNPGPHGLLITPDNSSPRYPTMVAGKTAPQNEIKSFRESYPNIQDCEYSLLAPSTPTYNCWAWSVNRSDGWVGRPLPPNTKKQTDPVTGITIIDIGQMWGGHNDAWTEADFDKYYAAAGVEPDQLTPTYPDHKFVPTDNLDEADVLLYKQGAEIKHAARIHASQQSGMGKWRMFESKLGSLEKIEHVYDQLDGGDYGKVFKMYKQVPR